MTAIIVTYDTRDSGATRTRLLSQIHKYQGVRLTSSAYLIHTDCRASEIFDALIGAVGPMDSLYVWEAGYGRGRGDSSTNGLLDQYLNGVPVGNRATLH